jgi:hypothetical protein
VRKGTLHTRKETKIKNYEPEERTNLKKGSASRKEMANKRPRFPRFDRAHLHRTTCDRVDDEDEEAGHVGAEGGGGELERHHARAHNVRGLVVEELEAADRGQDLARADQPKRGNLQ